MAGVFSKAGYIIEVGFKILTLTPVPKLPRDPHIHRGNEKVYKFKEQCMNRSTFSEIKYMNRLGFFQRLGIWLGLVSKY